MAGNLKDYRKRRTDGGAEKRIEQPPKSDESIEKIVDRYGGKSEDELMRELFRMTGEQKREGSFDAAAMRKTASSIMPMLNAEQRQKLEAILDKLG